MVPFTVLRVLLTAAALPAFSSAQSSGSSQSDGFVGVRNGQFELNGAPFQFIGTNAYWLPSLTSEQDVNDTLRNISALGIKVVRTWAFNDVTQVPANNGTYFQLFQNGTATINDGSTGLQRLDNVIRLAKAVGLHVQLALTNNWNPLRDTNLAASSRGVLSNDYGGMDFYVRNIGLNQSHDEFYVNSTIIDAFKNYTRFVLQRYANETAVFAWELANDPRCNSTMPTSGDCSTTVVTRWHSNLAQHVKRFAPNHLVSSGANGFQCRNCPKLFPLTVTSTSLATAFTTAAIPSVVPVTNTAVETTSNTVSVSTTATDFTTATALTTTIIPTTSSDTTTTIVTGSETEILSITSTAFTTSTGAVTSTATATATATEFVTDTVSTTETATTTASVTDTATATVTDTESVSTTIVSLTTSTELDTSVITSTALETFNITLTETDTVSSTETFSTTYTATETTTTTSLTETTSTATETATTTETSSTILTSHTTETDTTTSTYLTTYVATKTVDVTSTTCTTFTAFTTSTDIERYTKTITDTEHTTTTDIVKHDVTYTQIFKTTEIEYVTITKQVHEPAPTWYPTGSPWHHTKRSEERVNVGKRQSSITQLQPSTLDGSLGVDTQDILGIPDIGFNTFQLFPDQSSYSTNDPSMDAFNATLRSGIDWIDQQATDAAARNKPSVITGFGLVSAQHIGTYVPFNQSLPESSNATTAIANNSVAVPGLTPQQQAQVYQQWIQSAINKGIDGIIHYQWGQNNLTLSQGSPVQPVSSGTPAVTTSNGSPDDGYASSSSASNGDNDVQGVLKAASSALSSPDLLLVRNARKRSMGLL